MDRNITLEFLTKFRIGNYIRPYIIKLLKYWHVSSILWIYYILFCLFIFSLVTLYVNYFTIVNLG